jgi:hypothetical protein
MQIRIDCRSKHRHYVTGLRNTVCKPQPGYFPLVFYVISFTVYRDNIKIKIKQREYKVYICNQLDVTFSKFFTLFLQLYMFRVFLAHLQECRQCRQCHVRTYYFGLTTGLHTIKAHIHLSSQKLPMHKLTLEDVQGTPETRRVEK